ncbi:quinone-dependent dihydroorotate dehydrogenase [Amphibiibacter pelophylacis]|uniref:Quinone-dependent dihydroorotate dehydrogenase n=1 Tax=Amphibiibacter pelophylacis TaxID=1799477 RepID=A0ACC6P0S6_9BURK
MFALPFSLARKALFAMDAERAHDLALDTLARLQHTPLRCTFARERVSDPVEIAGLRLPNRVGLAAGLDKNGRCIDAFAAMGFGFVEVGTVTPLAQPGNARPRIFRLEGAQAIINRMGFNNAGLQAFVRNVATSRELRSGGGRAVVGLNIGKNAATPIENAASDYLAGLRGVYALADYVTVNISSPNTQNLRSLQEGQALADLLGQLMAERDRLALEHGARKPLFVKIAPDLDDAAVDVLAETVRASGVDGIIATNTTLARDAVSHLPHGNEAGGLSGPPVRAASLRVLARLRQRLPGLPLIGVGGISSAQDAVDKLHAGASAVQIYTGLIYKGPDLVGECARALRDAAAPKTKVGR